MAMFEKSTAKDVLTPKEIAVAEYIGSHLMADRFQIADILGVSTPYALEVIESLATRGIIQPAEEWPKEGNFRLTDKYRELYAQTHVSS